MPATSPIPIAICLTSFDPGGTERQMTELISRLDPARFEVHAVCLRREGLWLNKVLDRAVSVPVFPLRSFGAPSTARRLWQFAAWCRSQRIAIVQACDFYTNVFAMAGGALARVPVRIASRRDLLLPGRSAAQHRLQRYAYRLAHRVVANSGAAAAQVAREGIADWRIAVIPNGVDLSRYSQRGVRHGRPVVTTVANLRSEKGHDVLLDAIALLRPTRPDVLVQLVGAGSLRASLERRVAAMGLEGQVRFLGHREDVPEILAGSDVFVLPSRSEAFPNGLVEAMAAGLPCIASDVGGIPELVQHQHNGLLVPVGDPAALADAISSLMARDERARQLGDAARRTIEVRYSFERMVDQFEELYERQLAGSRLPIHAQFAR